MSILVEGFLRGALVTLHSLLWAREALRWTLSLLWTSLAFSFKHKGTKLESIAEDSRILEKVPSHLAVVVQEEHISCEDLARIATWAFASNIRTVSLYDPYGKIVEEMIPLRRMLQRYHHQLFSPPLPDVQVCSSREVAADSSTEEQLNHLTEDKGRVPYRVVVLCPEDGQRSVVEAAVGVCQSALKRGVGTHQVDTEMVNNRLSSPLGLPDPQLALVFGSMCSTVGYPPWQLRLTEIHTIPTHHKVPYQHFLQGLQCYSSCQQRCGK